MADGDASMIASGVAADDLSRRGDWKRYALRGPICESSKGVEPGTRSCCSPTGAGYTGSFGDTWTSNSCHHCRFFESESLAMENRRLKVSSSAGNGP